jgi:hypothetical protein
MLAVGGGAVAATDAGNTDQRYSTQGVPMEDMQ